MNEIILQNKNGEILASSLDIAECFNKRHDSILRDIENIMKSDSTILWNGMFIESTYENRGKQYKCFDLNRDGFSLLAMGFTGKNAIQWKLKYIEAFNKMEEKLKASNLLSNEEKLKLQLFSKDPLEVVTAHNQLVELKVNAATTPLLETIEEQKPKAEFHDAVHTSVNSVSAGKFSGVLQQNPIFKNLGRNKLYQWFRDNDYVCGYGELKNKPTQKALSAGYMDYEENVGEDFYGNNRTTYKALITGKGQIYFTKKLRKEFK